MPEIDIDFLWSRDEKGYSLSRGPRLPPLPGPIHTPVSVRLLSRDHPTDRWRIVRNGGRAISTQPLRQIGNLWQVFATSVKDAESALAFVRNYGPLTEEGLNRQQGDHLVTILAHAEAMRWLTKFLMRAAMPKIKGRRIKPKDRRLAFTTVGISLVPEPTTNRLRLHLAPHTLLEGLWLQAARYVSGDHPMRSCMHCGELFSVGAGTTRRLDAQFCTEEHKIRFHSLKRSGK